VTGFNYINAPELLSTGVMNYEDTHPSGRKSSVD
jgi:hypothetical protein